MSHGPYWAAFQRSRPLPADGTYVICFVVLLIFVRKNHPTHFAMLYGSIAVIVAFSLVHKAYRPEIPPPPQPLVQPHWCSYDGDPSSGKT